MGNTKVFACKCKHKVQDRLYGLGNRLHNKAPGAKGCRCTVCGAIHEIRDMVKDDAKHGK